MSRATVRKVLRHETPPGYRRRKERPHPTLDRHVATIHSLLDRNAQVPDRERLSVLDIFVHLTEQCDFDGSYSTLHRYIKAQDTHTADAPWEAIYEELIDLPRKQATGFLRALVQGVRPSSLGKVAREHLRQAGLLRNPSRIAADRSRWLEWIYLIEQGTTPSCVLGGGAPDDNIAKHLTPERVFERKKALTVLAAREGFSKAQISQFLSVDRKTVRKYIADFNSGGGELLFGRSERSKKSENDELKKAVVALLHEPPSLYGLNRTAWKMADLRAVLSDRGHVVGFDVIRQVIRATGFTWKKARIVLTSSDPDYREKLAHVQEILANLKDDERFFSVDEYGPFAIKMRGGRALVGRETPYTVPQWQESKGWLIMTAALELSGNQVTHFYSKAKNTAEMIRMAEVLVRQSYSTKKLYLSWDAASWHMSKKLTAFIEAHNADTSQTGYPLLELAPLPSGAQFLNVIESVFSGMARAIIHNSDYSSISEAMQAIDRYFADRNEHFTQNPRRAGKKIWRSERTTSEFDAGHSCKDPAYR
jgi:transposase